MDFEVLATGEGHPEAVSEYQAGDLAVLEIRVASHAEGIQQMGIEIQGPEGISYLADATGFGREGLTQVAAKRQWSIPLTAPGGNYVIRAELKMTDGNRVWLSQDLKVRKADLDTWFRHAPLGSAARNSYTLKETGERAPVPSELRMITDGHEKGDDGLPEPKVDREPTSLLAR